MPVVWRIASTLTAVLLVVSLLSWYVGARASWVFHLSKRTRALLAALIAAALAATTLARTLGPAHADVAAPLGAFGGTVVLAVIISSVLLAPVELGRLIAALFARLWRTSLRSRAATDAPSMPERREFVARAATAGALSLGVGSALYGTLVGRHDYTLETVPVRLAKLPRTLDGLTLVQLSDIHVGTFVGERELAAALDFVRRAKADAVVLTGDLLDHDLHYAPVLARFARSLRSHARFGVYAIPGNHDHYAGASEVMRHLREAGTDVLLNRHVLLGKGRDALVLAGLDDVAGERHGSEGPRLESAFDGASPDLARVLLSHNPAFFPHSHTHSDLTLSGHTHGGQITLFINPAELVLRHGFVRGHYAFGDSQLYVNRGFGTAGPPARVGSPPEITRIVLSRG
jgi:predicted MPP superfamily phosphohydrolase